MPSWILWNLGTSGEDLREDLSSYKVFDIRDLIDGYNQPEVIAVKLHAILESVKKKDVRIVVKCQAGISRSNALVMGVLCLYNNLDWDDAERIVRCLVPRANPNQGILDATKEAVQIIKTREI